MIAWMKRTDDEDNLTTGHKFRTGSKELPPISPEPRKFPAA